MRVSHVHTFACFANLGLSQFSLENLVLLSLIESFSNWGTIVGILRGICSVAIRVNNAYYTVGCIEKSTLNPRCNEWFYFTKESI